MAPRIHSGVNMGRRTFLPGEEEELAKQLTKDQVQYLTERGAISGFAPEGAQSEGDDVIDITSAAAKLAEAEGIDLESIGGTGAGGRVTKADVEAAIAAREEGDEDETGDEDGDAESEDGEGDEG